MTEREIMTELLESSVNYGPRGLFNRYNSAYNPLRVGDPDSPLTLATPSSFIHMVGVSSREFDQLFKSHNLDTLLYWDRVIKRETIVRNPLNRQKGVYLTSYRPSACEIALSHTYENRKERRLSYSAPTYVALGRGTTVPTPRHMAGFMPLYKKRVW